MNKLIQKIKQQNTPKSKKAEFKYEFYKKLDFEEQCFIHNTTIINSCCKNTAFYNNIIICGQNCYVEKEMFMIKSTNETGSVEVFKKIKIKSPNTNCKELKIGEQCKINGVHIINKGKGGTCVSSNKIICGKECGNIQCNGIMIKKGSENGSITVEFNNDDKYNLNIINEYESSSDDEDESSSDDEDDSKYIDDEKNKYKTQIEGQVDRDEIYISNRDGTFTIDCKNCRLYIKNRDGTICISGKNKMGFSTKFKTECNKKVNNRDGTRKLRNLNNMDIYISNRDGTIIVKSLNGEYNIVSNRNGTIDD